MNLTSACLLLSLASAAGFATSGGGTESAADTRHGASPGVPRHRGAGSTDLQSAQGTPIAAGPYTASQAERGKAVYEQNCSTCHGASLRGGANEFAAPALAGPFFYEKWGGRPLEELFRYTVENMPPDQARLSEAAYLEVTAYVLQVLQYPAGNTDLNADAPAMKRGIERPR